MSQNENTITLPSTYIVPFYAYYKQLQPSPSILQQYQPLLKHALQEATVSLHHRKTALKVFTSVHERLPQTTATASTKPLQVSRGLLALATASLVDHATRPWVRLKGTWNGYAEKMWGRMSTLNAKVKECHQQAIQDRLNVLRRLEHSRVDMLGAAGRVLGCG